MVGVEGAFQVKTKTIRSFMRSLIPAVCVCAMTVNGAAEPPADRDRDRRQIELPAQPLDAALLEIGALYDIDIVAPDLLTAGKAAPALRGALTAEEAVSRLLSGSQLVAERSDAGAFVVAEQRFTEADRERYGADIVVETITVFGQKRELSLKDTTASVAVFQERFARDLTFTELTDLYRITPNVGQLDSSEGGFSIRGVPVFGGVGNAGVAQSSALYVDDIFQSVLGIEGGPSGIFDIEQVEIYRGPQSTVQGRNTLMGAVLVRTQDPAYDWSAKGRFEYSEFNTQRYGLAFGGPVIDDAVAFRVASDFRTTDGFVRNPVTGRDDQDADDALTLRGKLLIEPTDRFSALATYVYSEGDASTGLGSGVVQGPDFFERQVSVDNPVLQEIETHNTALKLHYEVSDNLSIESVTTYSDAAEVSAPRFELDPVSTTLLDIGSDSEEIITTDLRLLYDQGPLNLVGGFFYFNREQFGDRDLSGRLVIRPGVLETDFRLLTTFAQQTENFAFYIDGDFDITDRLSVLFGGRYDREKFEQQNESTTTANPEIPFIGLVNEPLVILNADTTFDAFLPKAGLRYDITDTQTIGFVVQRGYRSGGAGISAAGDPFEFDSEFVWNYELSYRANFFDGRATFNANAFYIDWTDQQVSTGAGVNIVTVNAASSRLWGIEGELYAYPTEALTLFATLGYNNTKLTDFASVDPLLTGNEFPRSPEFQTSFGAVYKNEQGVFASFDGTYVSEAFSDAENSPGPLNPSDNRLASYVVFNAKAGYEADRWALYGFVRNAFDEEYALLINQDDFRSGGLGSAVLGAPQVFGVELTFDY